MELALQDKHALVTGASGGIGLEITKLLLAEGAKVTACYGTQERGLEKLVNTYGSKLLVAQADVSNESEINSLFDKATSTHGRIDIAIANAGIANHEGKGIHDLTMDQWTRTLTVNLTGAFLTAKYFFVI